MTVQHILYISLVILPALYIAKQSIIRQKNYSIPLILSGILIAFFGFMLAILNNENPIDILIYKEIASFGRAYAVGSMLFLSGVLIKIYYLIKK